MRFKIGDKVKLIRNKDQRLYAAFNLTQLSETHLNTVVTVSKSVEIHIDDLDCTRYFFDEMPSDWYALEFEMELYKREELLEG
jgi:hypothetical protein